MAGKFLTAERLLASQKGLCRMKYEEKLIMYNSLEHVSWGSYYFKPYSYRVLTIIRKLVSVTDICSWMMWWTNRYTQLNHRSQRIKFFQRVPNHIKQCRLNNLSLHIIFVIFLPTQHYFQKVELLSRTTCFGTYVPSSGPWELTA
jgi:hypothetical protein